MTATLTRVPAEDVYNLPLFETFIVMDARPVAAYNAEHIVTALSFPVPSVDTSEAVKLLALVQFLTTVTTNLPERYDPVILYDQGDNSTEFQEYTSWLVTIINKMKGDNLALTLSSTGTPILQHKSSRSEDEKYNPVQSFFDTLVQKVKRIWVIEGGYDAFKVEFPFLCGNLKIDNMKPLPHQIEKNLFLGSRAFTISPESLQQLYINYVIVNKSPNNDKKLAINNVYFLECDVEDESAENMSDCWRTAIAFIRSAHAAGGKVLVQLWGRSRSASVILAWLTVSKGWTLEAAEQFLQSKCSSVDRSLLFTNQLRQFIQSTKTIENGTA